MFPCNAPVTVIFYSVHVVILKVVSFSLISHDIIRLHRQFSGTISKIKVTFPWRSVILALEVSLRGQMYGGRKRTTRRMADRMKMSTSLSVSMCNLMGPRHQLLLNKMQSFLWRNKSPWQQEILAKTPYILALAARISKTNLVTSIFYCTKVISTLR